MRWKKSGHFSQLSAIRGPSGDLLEGPEMMEEFRRQMQHKQGRASAILPDWGAGETSLQFTGA